MYSQIETAYTHTPRILSAQHMEIQNTENAARFFGRQGLGAHFAQINTPSMSHSCTILRNVALIFTQWLHYYVDHFTALHG